jgi:hypothetical protein
LLAASDAATAAGRIMEGKLQTTVSGIGRDERPKIEL